MKKLLVYGPLAMALVAALAMGIPAAVAADTSDTTSSEISTTTDEQNPRQELISKVAEILNLDEATVNDAFRQATQERQQERLQNAIDNGLITEEEVAEVQAWWDSKPAALEEMGPMGNMGGESRFMRHGPMGGSDED